MSDDFFSNVPLRRSPSENDPPNGDFAHAISVRFGSTDLRTARLLPGDLPANDHPSPPLPAPLAYPPPPPPPPPGHPPSFSSVPPETLASYLADPCSLVLDIRPHAAHAAARINNALSLSVPTTLLKRPLYSLSKLSQMLPSRSSRARFADWSSASCILVYDSDSISSPDNSIIAGLLRKFRAEGFAGELGWIRGGFQAVWREVRHLATTEPPPPEEDDPDVTSSSGTLRTTHLPRAAFSLFSTTAAPPPQLGAVHDPIPFSNTPAPSASCAANPFFDTIRQNVELSHGITERIPLRLPRRVRRRIPDLPSRWLQDIAHRSALRRSSASRHPGFDSLESGSESGDDPHTSDPDENDPNIEEGTETLAMQFYRIELAEQRRLRSIMEHHTRESQASALAASARPRRLPDKHGGGVSMRVGAKSVPATPHPASFPYSITAAVEKGTKNRYTHIWPFEHARVRLHDGYHQGSHPGRRDRGKASERGRNTRDRSGGKARERKEQEQGQDKQRRSRSSPAFGDTQDQEMVEINSVSSRHCFNFDVRSSTVRTSVEFEAEPAHPNSGPSPSVPRVNIEYDTTEQDFWTSGPPTPSTALPLPTPPFYTPMEILPVPTPMGSWAPHLLSPSSGVNASSGGRLEGTQVAPPTSSLPRIERLPSFPLRLPNHTRSLSPSIGDQIWTSVSLPSPAVPFGAFTGGAATDGEAESNIGTRSDLRREPSPVDDYVNASYIQPLCTRKRYIATQGPLPSTFIDFWTLVWEQNVHVIVMLTREVENATVKCGSYWTDCEYGPLRLELLSTSPPMSPRANLATDISKQGFFAIREPQEKTSRGSGSQPTLITRTFMLGHTSYPGVPPRRITHFQYLDWSDMNVPDDPRGVLDLVQKVEQTVAESTPSLSPSGGPSPGSSLSGDQSPDIGPDHKGYDMLLSPTSAGASLWGGRGRRGSEWRHPELDFKSGIATFALGKNPPVLLHCSAGVGRTGGFIAVDAVLDGIRTELRKNIEERRMKQALKIRVAVGPEDKAAVRAIAEFGVGSAEMEVNNVGSCDAESIPGKSERMDVDEPAVNNVEKIRVPPHIINTVPDISAGDRTKGRRRRSHGKDISGKRQCSRSEPLVVHVPYAGTDDMSEGANVAGINLRDAKDADWQSSTREWVEKVSDQTHTHAEEGSFPLMPPAPFPSSRERSPGSTSNSSGPSAHNSTDDSTSASVDAWRYGSGNRGEQKSDTDSASGSGTGSGCLPPSSVSKLGSGSISLSTSGSGAGTGSRIGSSLLHARFQDSSVTSMSNESMDSLPFRRELKLSAPLHRPLAVIHSSSSSDMEIDCPPRSVSEPLQPTRSETVGLPHGVRSSHDKPILGPSPVARFSSPILPPGTLERDTSFFGSDPAEGPTSRSSSAPYSDDLVTLPQEFESGECAGADLRLDTESNALVAPEILHSGSTIKNPPLPSKGNEREISLASCASDDSASRQIPIASGTPGVSERGQHAANHPFIDYKLPRELHSDLLPPPISSFAEPIYTIIQDMREQRMSLCQSLRQYVFVHAAIIEGALRIVDEERELCGYCGTSDDTSSAEGEPRANSGTGERRFAHGEVKVWSEGASEAEVVAMRLEAEDDSTPHRMRSLHTTTQLSKPWSLEGNIGSSQVSLVPTSSSSGVSSPSKGKRAPSPTELLKEDKTGALSLNKRPSINRTRTNDEGDQFSFELCTSSPVAGEDGGGPGDIVASTSTARCAPGHLGAPEKGGPTAGRTR